MAAEAEADAQEEAAWLAEERMRREEVSAAAAASTVITRHPLSLSLGGPTLPRRWAWGEKAEGEKALGEKGVGGWAAGAVGWGALHASGIIIVIVIAPSMQAEMIEALEAAKREKAEAEEAIEHAWKEKQEALEAVRRPLRPCWRPFGLRFTYVTSVLVNKY
eukprot:COSAG01_NODE_1746_length_9334_cov_42.941419_2_plen_162_part_00